MAFLLFKDASARVETVRNLKAVYAMRSRYIHHRVPLKDEGELEAFVRNTNFVLSNALRFSRRFATRTDFIASIDKLKYGGAASAS